MTQPERRVILNNREFENLIMENRAIQLLKEKRKDLIERKQHNQRIKIELPIMKKMWASQGCCEEIIEGRAIRLFGDFMPYDKKLHHDINSLLKYLRAENKI